MLAAAAVPRGQGRPGPSSGGAGVPGRLCSDRGRPNLEATWHSADGLEGAVSKFNYRAVAKLGYRAWFGTLPGPEFDSHL